MFTIMHMMNKCLCGMCRWARSYLYFSKGAPFISGLLLSFKFLENSFILLLLYYPPKKTKDEIFDYDETSRNFRNAAVITTALICLRTFTTSIFHYIAENCIGDFKLIVYSFPALFIGLFLASSWWFSVHIGNGILYLSLAILMVGSAGMDSSADYFLSEQFIPTMDNIIDESDSSETDTIEDQFLIKKEGDEYSDKLETRTIFWKYSAASLGSLASWAFGPTSIYDATKTSVMVSLLFVGVSYLVFCSGKCCRCYYHAAPKRRTVGSVVKKAKPLVKLLPLWITLISCSLVYTTGPVLFYAPTTQLDYQIINVTVLNYHIDEIPLNAFYMLQSISRLTASLTSDFLIQKFWSGKETIQHRARFARVGIAMLFASGCCITASRVELRRLSKLEDSNSMTVLWIAPQFCLLGIMMGLLENGLRDFFNDRVPVSMRFLQFPFNETLLGIGGLFGIFSILVAPPWMGKDINQSRVDKYLLVLAILNIFSLFVYILLFCKYDWNVVVPPNGHDVPVEEVSSPTELVVESSSSVS